MRRLLVFTKEPAPGRVKTRVAAELGHEPAADLARALLADTLALAAEGARLAGAAWTVVHAPDRPSAAFLAGVRAAGAEARPQGDGDLGRRLRRALAASPSARVAIGSDAPDLPPATIAEAFARLEGSPAVLGPATDGGYYLVGLAAGTRASALGGAMPIRWSHPRTLVDTVAALEAAGAGPVAFLEERADVDDAASLRALAQRLRARSDAATATQAWLTEAGLGAKPRREEG